MSSSLKDNLKTAFIVIVGAIATMKINSLPWWSFIVTVFIIGAVITLIKWNVRSFMTGFISGVIIWAGGNLFYHLLYSGIILKKAGPTPTLLFLVSAGLAGGLLTGLALYSGKKLLSLRDL